MNTDVYGVTLRNAVGRQIVDANAQRRVLVSLSEPRPDRFPSVSFRKRRATGVSVNGRIPVSGQ